MKVALESCVWSIVPDEECLMLYYVMDENVLIRKQVIVYHQP
jgi:hypothetical protein